MKNWIYTYSVLASQILESNVDVYECLTSREKYINRIEAEQKDEAIAHYLKSFYGKLYEMDRYLEYANNPIIVNEISTRLIEVPGVGVRAIGCSPDGFLRKIWGCYSRPEDLGLVHIELQSAQNQIIKIINGPPKENIYAQAELYVTGRDYCDMVYYCPGLRLLDGRIWKKEALQQLISDAIFSAYVRLEEMSTAYHIDVEKLPP